MYLRADQQVRGLVKPARAWPHAGRLPWTTLRAPVGLPTGAEWPVWRGTPPGRLVANDIKPGVCSGHGHTAPGTVTEGRRASSRTRRQRGPSVAVRGNADGAHRPPQLCTPTVVTVHTDRPCGTDARPLCVRGQRNMTVYSATR